MRAALQDFGGTFPEEMDHVVAGLVIDLEFDEAFGEMPGIGCRPVSLDRVGARGPGGGQVSEQFVRAERAVKAGEYFGGLHRVEAYAGDPILASVQRS